MHLKKNVKIKLLSIKSWKIKIWYWKLIVHKPFIAKFQFWAEFPRYNFRIFMRKKDNTIVGIEQKFTFRTDTNCHVIHIAKEQQRA